MCIRDRSKRILSIFFRPNLNDHPYNSSNFSIPAFTKTPHLLWRLKTRQLNLRWKWKNLPHRFWKRPVQLQNCKKNDKGNKRLRRPGTIRRHPDRTQRFLRPRQNTAKTLRKKEIPLLYPLPAIRKIHSQMLPPGPGRTLAECRRSRKIWKYYIWKNLYCVSDDI